MTSTATGILFALNEHKEIHGTERLTLLLNIHPSHKSRVFAEALSLKRMGMIDMEISPGGRGNKTIYRDRGVIKVEPNGSNN